MSKEQDSKIPTFTAWAVARASRLSRGTLAWGGLALAAVVLLSLNLATSLSLKNARADLTEEGLYTISDGTKAVLKSIDEPVTARLYFSDKLGQAYPSVRRYFDRVRALLEQYRDISGGKVKLEILDPEPFSDAEDRAVAAGMRGLRISREGELGYFGLAAANATDTRSVIPFFDSRRDDFLEYDLTKLIHGLANPKRRVVGLMTALPVDGGTAPMTGQPLPVWIVMDQVREFFDVVKVDMEQGKIPSGIDVLMVAQPSKLSKAAAYAVDQWVLKGGKAIMLIDPMAESGQMTMLAHGGEGTKRLSDMLKAWGVDYDGKKVAADIKHARRISFGARQGQQGIITEFVTWLSLGKDNIDQDDVLAGGIDQLNFASAGSLSKADGAPVKFQPIVQTSTEASRVDATKTGFGADPITLLREYKAEGQKLTLAARVSGEAKTAWPKGNPVFLDETEDANPAGAAGEAKSEPKKDEPKKEVKPDEDPLKDHVASGNINLIVVADTDLLANQFWVQTREVLGQETQVPTADNAAFLIGMLENLSGSDALIALRGRGVKERPFTMVNEIRRESEKTFREKEQALQAKLKSVEGELQKLEVAGEGGATLLTDKEREAVDKFKAEMLATRRELREVQLGLRKDIDSLNNWLQFANIALVPLGIAFGGLGWSLWQSRRKQENKVSAGPVIKPAGDDDPYPLGEAKSATGPKDKREAKDKPAAKDRSKDR